jgi:hypothetical protein
VILAIDELDLDVDHRESGATPDESTLSNLLDAGNVFPSAPRRRRPSIRTRSLCRLVRLDDDGHGRELAVSAGLLLVGVAVLDPQGATLAKRHLRRADIGVDL